MIVEFGQKARRPVRARPSAPAPGAREHAPCTQSDLLTSGDCDRQSTSCRSTPQYCVHEVFQGFKQRVDAIPDLGLTGDDPEPFLQV